MKQKLTVTMDEELITLLKEMAAATHTTLSACVNNWIRETEPAITHMLKLVATMKNQGGIARAMNDLTLFQERARDQMADVDQQMSEIMAKQTTERPPAAQARTAAKRTATPARPPASNTGVNPSVSKPKNGGKQV